MNSENLRLDVFPKVSCKSKSWSNYTHTQTHTYIYDSLVFHAGNN